MVFESQGKVLPLDLRNVSCQVGSVLMTKRQSEKVHFLGFVLEESRCSLGWPRTRSVGSQGCAGPPGVLLPQPPNARITGMHCHSSRISFFLFLIACSQQHKEKLCAGKRARSSNATLSGAGSMSEVPGQPSSPQNPPRVPRTCPPENTPHRVGSTRGRRQGPSPVRAPPKQL